MPEPAGLRELQGWLHGAIVRPDAEPPPVEVERVVRSSARLSARERLELYRRSYRRRLLETMRAGYPGLRHLLGAELFDDFALDYLEAHPSSSYTLLRLGEHFPDHLAATRPDPEAAGGSWPVLIVDLARLERAFAEVYDGPGVEGKSLPSGRDLPSEPDPRWLGAAVEVVPCLRLMCFSFPVAPYLRDVRGGAGPPPPEPAESFLALSRRDYVVSMTPLGAAEHGALERLSGGGSLEAAAAAAGIGTAEAWALARRWADLGFLRSKPTQKERVTP